MKKRLLLIGPQGAGKSTQAKLLAQHLNIPHISTGDIFREMPEVREILAAGKLVDDQTTCEIVKKRLQADDCKNGFILDGYPRNLTQKELFDPEFDKVIYLSVSDEEIFKRMLSRGRADDTKEAIENRLELYREQTKPLLNFYQQQGILVEVDGTGSVEEIKEKIMEAINGGD